MRTFLAVQGGGTEGCRRCAPSVSASSELPPGITQVAFYPSAGCRHTLAFVPTVVHGDFEWDEAKAASNAAKHGVSFEEAAFAMRDPFSQDFDDALQPANLVTLASAPSGRILYIVTTESDHR